MHASQAGLSFADNAIPSTSSASNLPHNIVLPVMDTSDEESDDVVPAKKARMEQSATSIATNNSLITSAFNEINNRIRMDHLFQNSSRYENLMIENYMYTLDRIMPGWQRMCAVALMSNLYSMSAPSQKNSQWSITGGLTRNTNRNDRNTSTIRMVSRDNLPPDNDGNVEAIDVPSTSRGPVNNVHGNRRIQVTKSRESRSKNLEKIINKLTHNLQKQKISYEDYKDEKNSNEIEIIICERDLSVLMESGEEADYLLGEHKTDHDFGRSQ
jgi:hypothetical protein